MITTRSLGVLFSVVLFISFECLSQNERILLNIQRKFNLNENIYNYLLEKRAEASITKASNISDHKVIDMPRLESNLPIKPNTNSFCIRLI